jgi:hypothetical protein
MEVGIGVGDGVGVGDRVGVGVGISIEVAFTTAKSPSTRLGVLEIVALKELFTATLLPSFKVSVVGLQLPVSVASTGSGLVPPIGIGLPLKDMPSAEGVKYEASKVWLEPLEKSTCKLRLERLTAVDTGHVISGEIEELGPV